MCQTSKSCVGRGEGSTACTTHSAAHLGSCLIADGVWHCHQALLWHIHILLPCACSGKVVPGSSNLRKRVADVKRSEMVNEDQKNQEAVPLTTRCPFLKFLPLSE